MKKIYGVIMAGGGGTRFWPLSRMKNPKQLLNLSGKDVMINETLNRLDLLCDKENVYIVTNEAQVEKTLHFVGNRIYSKNVLAEPCARNTSACIGYSAIRILKEKGDGVMIVTPSDAYIKDEKEYARLLSLAVIEAETSDSVITLGINPTFPATGYGYIEFEKSESPVKKVERFVEKPDAITAKSYLESGNFAWNSGVFVFKASVIMKKIKECLPDVYDKLSEIYQAIGEKDESEVIKKVYPEIRSISIDYGVMEKIDDIKVITGEFGWNDVGSFDMLGVLHDKDENGNVKIGDTTLVDTTGSTVYSSGRKVAVLGMDNVIVVETPDAVLVCPKGRAQDIKSIISKLKEEGNENLL